MDISGYYITTWHYWHYIYVLSIYDFVHVEANTSGVWHLYPLVFAVILGCLTWSVLTLLVKETVEIYLEICYWHQVEFLNVCLQSLFIMWRDFHPKVLARSGQGLGKMILHGSTISAWLHPSAVREDAWISGLGRCLSAFQRASPSWPEPLKPHMAGNLRNDSWRHHSWR